MIIAILNLFRMAILSFSLSMRYFRSLILLACICLTVPLSAQADIFIFTWALSGTVKQIQASKIKLLKYLIDNENERIAILNKFKMAIIMM
ncbi:MAG: hypothetical protein N4A59_13340, partial [Marinifilum sp.]|jgi:hypothetical protein|nr:hypothetical protein [Marinifilum sp.]